ncbi:MAG TPA: Gfo/Idh/MocA family oxidoreductase [Blastocatellia bacterium]|jgi:predicted dehydrogenase|nr:Gfo/Idh/MocA family oxidoreductase [Blastocatellia bacterium]
MPKPTINRRDFVKTAVTAGAAIGSISRPGTASTAVIKPNDRINVGLIGVGGRGRGLLDWVMKTGEQPVTAAKLVAVSDVYGKRLREAKEKGACDAYLDYRELLERKDIDAVIIATPDHWHAQMAIEALDRGKDVYLEKPMTHTVDEAKRVYEKVKEKNRVLQVGSHTTSSDQWWKARKAIQDGMIGRLIMSQGSYHRNSTKGEWNWTIDSAAGPNAKGDDFIDWKMWLGDAPKRPYDADRFFRFRKYWDYSGGIATDLFYHVMAPMNICWGEAQFPYRVMASGGIYVFKDEREVPDTFNLTADYAQGHSVVLSSSMANETHIPGLIRGHEGTIVMVPNGRFEDKVDYITVTPQRIVKVNWEEKYGATEIKLNCEPREDHMQNFLRCVRSREKPVLDALTAYKAMVTIGMSVQSYREGRVLYFDERKQKVVTEAPKV